MKIEKLEIFKDDFTEFIPRLGKLTLTPPLSNRSMSPERKRSPERTILGQMAGDVRGDSDQGEEISIPPPKTDLNEMGLPKDLMTFLEVPHLRDYDSDSL